MISAQLDTVVKGIGCCCKFAVKVDSYVTCYFTYLRDPSLTGDLTEPKMTTEQTTCQLSVARDMINDIGLNVIVTIATKET